MQLQVAPDDVVTGVVDIEDRQAKPACEGSHRPRPAPRHPAGRSTSAPDVAAPGGPPVRRTRPEPPRNLFRRRAGRPRSHRSRLEEPPQGPGGPRLAAEGAAVAAGSTGAGVERRHQVGARESIARERPCSHGQEECPPAAHVAFMGPPPRPRRWSSTPPASPFVRQPTRSPSAVLAQGRKPPTSGQIVRSGYWSGNRRRSPSRFGGPTQTLRQGSRRDGRAQQPERGTEAAGAISLDDGAVVAGRLESISYGECRPVAHGVHRRRRWRHLLG